jgi:hypothetical protein
MKKQQITVQGVSITVINDDFISLTDIGRRFNERTDQLISNWLRSRATVDFLGTWEIIHNENFNPLEFEGIRNMSGANTFVLTVSDWVKATGAIGIQAKPGRYGGTFAHRDIAFEFLSYLSPSFKLFVVQEFQRLKSIENPEWDLRRSLSKVNYQLHQEAIREHILPAIKGNRIPSGLIAFSEEADMLNQAVFGVTAEQWRAENADLVAKGYNMRDVADIYQLLVLANIEAYNEVLINHEVERSIRAIELQRTAQRQLAALYNLNHLPLEKLLSPLVQPLLDENTSPEKS